MVDQAIRIVTDSCSTIRPITAPATIMVPNVKGTANAIPTMPNDHWNTTFPNNWQMSEAITRAVICRAGGSVSAPCPSRYSNTGPNIATVGNALTHETHTASQSLTALRQTFAAV